jgi:hypothetical protein
MTPLRIWKISFSRSSEREAGVRGCPAARSSRVAGSVLARRRESRRFPSAWTRSPHGTTSGNWIVFIDRTERGSLAWAELEQSCDRAERNVIAKSLPRKESDLRNEMQPF